MPTSRVVDVEGLSVTYGDVTAVRDLTFHVQQGELYALLGTNGAGKTSALDVIEGRRRATSGTVRVFGSDPLGRRAHHPRTGIVLQATGAAPDLTVQEAVGLIGSLGEVHEDVARVLGVAGLARKAGSLVSQLSDGEKRRLDLATAVCGGPELVVLDDPTTGLDGHSRDALWDAVHRLRDDGSTVLLTTQHPGEVQRADRIGLLHEGTLRREGTVAELMRSLPSVISFALEPGAPEPPIIGALDGAFHVETFNLQLDLHRLLVWADDNGVRLLQLRADPPRLDDVFLGSDAT
ncbi:ABC transporter ATP-binding protein [Geodermatophilus normandii]|uniref:ABC transporter ATP-binding protein n=1 Tax=Geodermatophilus normandii TaxID=1137989 RepID=A0A6P0GK94_9ACTN|nr:ABC transporter ATP-binding protein [Geodermatophilus normandii]NEM07727.1 ABC transporter ATP-binding protein [Geodermatophilus normandii]